MKSTPSVIDLLQSLADESKKWLWVKEQGKNKGAEVERFQKAIDGRSCQEPWCAGFVGFCIKELESRFGVKSQLNLSEHVLTMWNNNVKYRSQIPHAGYIAIWKLKGTASGHCGIVVEAPEKCEEFKTCEGNTAGPKDGIEREGDGVWLKSRKLHTPGDFKLMGFLKPF
jgi:hypothetical protein